MLKWPCVTLSSLWKLCLLALESKDIAKQGGSSLIARKSSSTPPVPACQSIWIVKSLPAYSRLFFPSCYGQVWKKSPASLELAQKSSNSFQLDVNLSHPWAESLQAPSVLPQSKSGPHSQSGWWPGPTICTWQRKSAGWWVCSSQWIDPTAEWQRKMGRGRESYLLATQISDNSIQCIGRKLYYNKGHHWDKGWLYRT